MPTMYIGFSDGLNRYHASHNFYGYKDFYDHFQKDLGVAIRAAYPPTVENIHDKFLDTVNLPIPGTNHFPYSESNATYCNPDIWVELNEDFVCITRNGVLEKHFLSEYRGD